MAESQRADLGTFVGSGGRFSSVRPVVIDRFPDGALFVRDGHHRVIAIHLYRRSMDLHESEYIVTERTYEMYTQPDLMDGWITPFDPRTEIRLAELSEYKLELTKLVRSGADPLDHITRNRKKYCREREEADSFDSLADAWHNRCERVRATHMRA